MTEIFVQHIIEKAFELTKVYGFEKVTAHMLPKLIDAVVIPTLGDFGSKAGRFVGRNMFGYASQNGYSITNLGKIQSNIIAER